MERSAFSHVTDDRVCPLSTLRAQAGKPLREAILEIYKHYCSANIKSVEFQKNLRCFLPVETADSRQYDYGGEQSKTLLRPCLKVDDYVAISYPWTPSDGESDNTGGYHLPDTTVLVRDIVLDRTIRFIRYKQGNRGMIPFWVDQLSVNQDNPIQREIEMQSMDFVYKQCTFAVGHLWIELKTQVQVDRLSSLLSGQIVKQTEGDPALEEKIDSQTVNEVLDLLVQITDDRWWSRAWIFQEDYLAGTKMWLLIRHTQGLDKGCARNELGSLPGELVFTSEKFRRYATLFCLALSQKMDQPAAVRDVCQTVLRKAGKYNILQKYGRGQHDLQKNMTISILEGLNQCHISVPADILAICANVCGYDRRVMSSKDSDLQMSLSLGILTLCVANGEIIRNDIEGGTPYVNIFDFLGNHGMAIRAPFPERALTFMKHCRLLVNDLSTAGIHTKGVLWKLSDIIRPNCIQQSSFATRRSQRQKNIYQNGLDKYTRSRLEDLVRMLKQRDKQRYKRLADDLAAYLKPPEQTRRRDDWPPTLTMDMMAASIVDAMDSGKYLQVAHTVKGFLGGGRSIPYRAIFVRDRHEMRGREPTYIFTSWNRTNERLRDEATCRSLAKYVSMEVSIDGMTRPGLRRLRSKRWTNGLCFFNGEKKLPFVFAWPELLCG